MTNDKKNRVEKLKKMMTRQKLQSIFTFSLGALLLIQVVQFYQFRERLAFIDGLYEKNTTVLSDLNKGKEYLSSFGADLNEIRQFLLLPTKPYDFSAMTGVELASEDGEDLNTQVFDFVNSLGKYEQNKALYDANFSALQAALSDPVWATSGLTLSNVSGQALEDRMEYSFTDASLGGAVFMKIDLSYDGQFSVPLYYKEVELTDSSSWASVFEDVKDFLAKDAIDLRMSMQKVNAARGSLKELLASSELQTVFSEKEMALSAEQENEEEYFYQLRNSQLVALGRFVVAKEDGAMSFYVDSSVDEDFDPLNLDGTPSLELLSALRDDVDSRTDLQKKIDEKKEELANIMSDRAFVVTLDQLGLHFGPITETETQIQYPILNVASEILRVMFIDKSTGEIEVMLPDGQEVQTLSMATEELTTGKKKLWTCLILSPVTLG